MESTPTLGDGHNRQLKARVMRCVPCRECGYEFNTAHGTKSFCSYSCQEAFKNRRKKRGVELYDFAMERRYNREHEKEARSIMDALCMGYRDEDKESRGGRMSWYGLAVALDNLSRLPGVRDGR